MKRWLGKCLLTASSILFLSSCASRAFNKEGSSVKAGVGGENDVFGTNGPKLAFDEYEVLFTNPVCKEYPYLTPVKSNGGRMLTAKPRNAFCSNADRAASSSRPESPQFKLISWINDPEVKEVFFTYLSFSNRDVQEALCKNVQTRNLKITFVLDAETDMAQANILKECQPANGNPDFKPKFFARGHVPGILIAHNKIFLFNPGAEKMRIVFSSGNMTSGIVTHHENWHFLRLPSKTFFATSHLCLMEGEINHANSGREYAKFINECRAKSGLPEESDIKAYFIPGDHDEGTLRGRASQTLSFALAQAKDISVAAHRFSYRPLLNGMRQAAQRNVPVRFIGDDDIWWAGHDIEGLLNTPLEFQNVEEIRKAGGKIKYLETNHGAGLLHHNKYVIMNMPDPEFSAVFAGAGNFTGTAFAENWEDFYYIRIPHVVDAYNKQYERMFNLASSPDDLPETNVLPPF